MYGNAEKNESEKIKVLRPDSKDQDPKNSAASEPKTREKWPG